MCNISSISFFIAHRTSIIISYCGCVHFLLLFIQTIPCAILKSIPVIAGLLTELKTVFQNGSPSANPKDSMNVDKTGNLYFLDFKMS